MRSIAVDLDQATAENAMLNFTCAMVAIIIL
jgi:hypothetical protein